MSQSKTQSLRAVVFGATGLVGQEVLKELINNKNIIKIHVVGRRPVEIQSSKIQFHLSDLEDPKKVLNVPADFALCCLGTTMAKAKSQKAFYHVDHDLVLNAAQACVSADIRTFGFISSLGASSKALSYYLKVKAHTEEDLKRLNFDKLVILRPGLLLGDRQENRPLENFFKKIDPYISPFFIGPLKRYRFVHARTVAQSFIENILTSESGVLIVENEKIS